MIEDGVTGRLIPPGDAAALTSAIAEIVDDKAAAAAMAHRARALALDRFDLRCTTRAIEAVYEKVLAA
jgi:mannosyltransferase